MTPEDYSELYDGLKSWIDGKTEKAKNRDFPGSVEELKKEIEKLAKLKSNEMPSKKRDMATLSEMHSKLEDFKKKRSSAGGVPADKDLSKLQAVSVKVNVCPM